ncbi:hypothetical protein ACQEVZ_39650 [Dactylosporangium sp. CA-152071]|uniref:hypothetical protein n=1 Tax=Dactylosporangium sp. CA-152071 TaxID=3239933 RepID=UPI003D8DFFE5
MPTPSGALLLPVSVSEGEVVRAQRYALSAAQTDEVRIIVAEEAQLRGPLLFRFLRGVPPSIFAVSYVDAVLVDPSPVAGVVVSAADMLARPVEVGLGSVDGFVGGVFEFRDGFGSVPRVFADRVRVWPVDAVDEGVNTAEAVAGRIGARFGVVPGSEAGTYGLGHGWVVQVFEWGLWVRPDGVTDGVVAGVVAGVEQRVAGEVGRGGAAPRPLVLLGESGGGTVPDVVLDRLEEARRVLPRRVVARLRVEWLGARPPSRVTELPDTVGPAAASRQSEHTAPVVPVEAAPGRATGRDEHADSAARLFGLDPDAAEARLRAAGTSVAELYQRAHEWASEWQANFDVYPVTLTLGRLPFEVPALAEQHGIPVGRLMALVKEAGLHPLHLAVLLPGAGAGLGAVLSLDGLAGGWERELDRLAGSVGLGYRWLRGMLADLGVPLGDVASGDVGGLVAQWVGLLLGGDAGFEEGSVVSVVNLIEQEVDAAGLDRAGIEAVAGVTGVSGAVVSALSLRFGRVPVELVTADRDGRVTLLAARLGVDPAVLLADSGLLGLLGAPALPPYSVVGPAGAARVTALMLREDPVWSAAHPPEQVFGVRLMDVVRRASVLGLAVEEVAPFVDWLAGQGRDLDGLAAGSSELVRLRQEWLAAEFHVRPGDIDDDEDVRPWLVHHEGLRLARRLRVAPQVVRQAALAADDLPVDLDEVAERLGVSAEALWNLAFDLDLDPWALEPILAGRSRSARLVVADVRADVDEWTALLGVSDRIALAFLRDTRRTSTDLGRTTINDLDAWAAVILGVDVEVARGYRERLGRRYLDPVLWAADGFTRTPGEVVRAAHASGVSPYWLAAASVRAGLPFTGLARAARRLEVDPLQLLAVAAALGVDPDTLRGWHGLGHRLNGPQPAGDRYGAARALADELRGDRHLHPAGPDGDRVLKLLLDALPPLTDNERDVVSRAVREARDADRLSTAVAIARSGLISHWAVEWAPRLGQSPEEVTRDLHRFVWLSPQAVEAVAAVIGEGTDPVEVWRFAVRVGRMPDDLHRIAERSNIRRSELFQMAVAFDADPRDLTPVVAVYDKDRPLADQIAEWVTWFDRWTDVRPDRGLLMTALHDTDMTVQWDGTDEELRDIVDSWIATTLGQDVEAFRELERAGPIDIRAGWELMAAVIPVPPQSTPLTTLSWHFRVSTVWLLGALLRSGTSASDLHRRTRLRAELALAADLGHWPELSPEEAQPLYVRHGPAGWWPAVREMAAAARRRPAAEAPQYRSHRSDSRSTASSTSSDNWEIHIEEILRESLIAIHLALFFAFPLLPLPPHQSRRDWFNHLRERIRDHSANDLRALNPQLRTAATQLMLASGSAKAEAATRLMAEFAEWLGEPWPVPGLSDGQTARVVHAAGVESRATHVEVAWYLSRAIEFFGDQRREHWAGRAPAPDSARLSRALGVDRVVAVMDSAGERLTPYFLNGNGAGSADARSFRPYLDDTEGIFIDALLAAYPDGGFIRFGGSVTDTARAFDGVVGHLATTADARGIVLYRVSAGTETETGVFNAFRGPFGEVLFLDPLTLLPAVLPVEGDVEVLFLPSRGPQPTADVTVVDPRTDLSWPDPLREWADALGASRLEVGQAFVDAGLTATWAGDLEAARAVVDAWQASVLGVTGVPASEAARIQVLTGRLVRLAGWSKDDVTKLTRLLGVSRAWLHAAVLLTGASPAELWNIADWPALRAIIEPREASDAFGPPQMTTVDVEQPPASHKTAIIGLFARLGRSVREDLELTDNEVGWLTERSPDGWHKAVEEVAARFGPPRRRAPWTDVLRLLPHIGDVTDGQLETLRAATAGDGVDVVALSVPLRAAYAAAVLGDAGALPSFLLPLVAEAGLVHASSGTATPIERQLYLSRGGLRLPRPQGASSGANPLDRVMALDEWRRGPDPDRPLPRLGRPRIADLLRRYPGSGGFVRFLDGAGRRVPGFGGLVRVLAGTGDAGIALYRSFDAAGGAVERVLYAFDEQGTVVLVDSVSLQLAELPGGAAADVLFLPTGGHAVPGGRTEPVDADADWAGTLGELFLPPLLLPDGVTELVNQVGGGALVVGASAVNSPLWTSVDRLAGTVGRRLVLVEPAGDDAVEVKLRVLLERLRLRGEVPVVVASRLTTALGVVSGQFGVPIVHQAAPPKGQSGLRLGNVWAVTSPGSVRAEHYAEMLTGQVLADAAARVVSVSPPPPMLASWLDAWARGDREGSQSMLAEHLVQLTSEAVLGWLAEMVQRAPRGVEDARVHDAVVRLARLDQADLAYRFLTAPDVAARVEATLSVVPEQLADVTDLLAHLGLAAAEGPVDRANAAVLRTLHQVLTTERPKTEWFPANVIRHLTSNDKLLWADRLGDLTRMPQFSPGQRDALGKLRKLTLEC